MPSPADYVNDISLPEGLLDEIGTLVRIMRRLRSPGGCPWDAAQTHESLLKNLLEETHEYIFAVETADIPAMREELGDLLLQIVFHGQIAEDSGTFTLRESVQSLTDKLIRRHPHVFGDVVVSNPEEALGSWNSTKKKENHAGLLLDSIPRSYPALLRARKIQEKVGRVGFEWGSIDGVFEKLEEEIAELKRAIKNGDSDNAKEELGDVIFIAAELGKYIGHCPETALAATLDKFQRRFAYIETTLTASGSSLDSADLDQMEALWADAKLVEKGIRPGSSTGRHAKTDE